MKLRVGLRVFEYNALCFLLQKHIGIKWLKWAKNKFSAGLVFETFPLRTMCEITLYCAGINQKKYTPNIAYPSPVTMPRSINSDDNLEDKECG